jgi:predicted DNA-binding protein (MmcQ/YjbR family)
MKDMTVQGASEQITRAALSWTGVEAHPHRFGGVEFRLGRREIGHIHGDALVDIPFPTRVRQEIVAAGQARPHHVLPESGWVSVYLHQPDDVERAIALLRRSFQIASAQRSKRKER